MVFLILFLLINLIFIAPVLTLSNLINIFKKTPEMSVLNDIIVMIVGFSCTILLFWSLGVKDYNQPLIFGDLGMDVKIHTPLASWHRPTILFFCSLAIVAYFILRFAAKKLSPIITVLCLSCIFLGCTLSVLFIIQLTQNIFIFSIYMALFPLNFIFSSISLLRITIKEQIKMINENNITYDSYILKKCKKILSKSISWIIIPFVLILPILATSIIILTLFGQRPDAIIKAFTETADWTLSQKIAPDPIIVTQDHYLCTVAVQGDEKVVKPTRLGLRRGKKIVVNRQLCIANAFEQCIQEKMPRTHRLIRNFYDRYGYPLSKHITTKKRANFTYRMMKPLEWFFIFFLYIVDKKPENRIAMQYIDPEKLLVKEII